MNDQIDMDGGVVDETQNQATDVSPEKDVDGVPYCRVHHCRMLAATSGRKGSRKAYYKCQVADCKETGVRIKAKLPNRPQMCPQCMASGEDVACERDSHRSTAASVVLVCPQCGWHTAPLATPQMALFGGYRRRRQAAAGNGGSIGDR